MIRSRRPIKEIRENLARAKAENDPLELSNWELALAAAVVNETAVELLDVMRLMGTR